MDAERFWKGFGWAVVATIVMSVVMIAGTLTGVAPMPKPIPVAIVAKLLGGGLAKPALMALGALTHLLYGGTFGGVLATVARPVTLHLIYGAMAGWLIDRHTRSAHAAVTPGLMHAHGARHL